jgi:hypothetical protein
MLFYKMKVRFSLLALAILLQQCAQTDKNALLQGAWRTDSVYTYYNGFGFTKRDLEEEPLRHYQADGKLMMTRDKEFRFFSYRIQNNDSLIHLNPKVKTVEKFLIIDLDHNRMILRKELRPLFQGPSQQRYEIRYLSRVKE